MSTSQAITPTTLFFSSFFPSPSQLFPSIHESELNYPILSSVPLAAQPEVFLVPHAIPFHSPTTLCMRIPPFLITPSATPPSYSSLPTTSPVMISFPLQLARPSGSTHPFEKCTFHPQGSLSLQHLFPFSSPISPILFLRSPPLFCDFLCPLC
jgi:hypothetical protein